MAAESSGGAPGRPGLKQEVPQWKARGEHALLNHEMRRVDGPDKVTGRARYSHDVRLPGMLYGGMLCCPVPVARVRVDVAPALAVPGVEVAIAISDGLKDGVSGWLGQPIAAVAATSEEALEDGLRALDVAIEELDWAVTPEQAAAEGAPQVTPRGNVRAGPESGDSDATDLALEACEVVVAAEYELPVQHHVCLETHGAVCDWRGGDEATIYCSTQATFAIAGEAARVLGLEAQNVRTIVHHMGGGFGSKFSLDLHGRIACLLSKEARKPVHLLAGRAEEFLTGGNRSGSRQSMVGGATRDGKFAALRVEAQRLGGLGGGSLPGPPYIYAVDRVWSRLSSVHTHTDSSRAMRAPGHPQASFAMESMVDELAYALEMDPLEFRRRNLADEVYHRQLDRVAREIGWHEHPNRTRAGRADGGEARGIGFALSTWGVPGQPNACECDVRIERDGGVSSSVGSQDLGTGVRTYVAAIVAEELGLPLAAVEARIGDSLLPKANGSGGSMTAPSLAPALKDGAHQARAAFAAHLAGVLGCEAQNLVFAGERVTDSASGESLSWRAACATLPVEGLSARGAWREHLAARGVHGAQAARVVVDTATGRVKVEKMVCIQDVGLPLNRTGLRSQINGGMIQALSYALLEQRVIDPDLGLMLSADLEAYKIAGSLEMPELVAIIDDDDDRNAVIGMGEPPVIPGAGAIANAVYNACGVRVRALPITPQRVLDALAERSW